MRRETGDVEDGAATEKGSGRRTKDGERAQRRLVSVRSPGGGWCNSEGGRRRRTRTRTTTTTTPDVDVVIFSRLFQVRRS